MKENVHDFKSKLPIRCTCFLKTTTKLFNRRSVKFGRSNGIRKNVAAFRARLLNPNTTETTILTV